MLYDLVLKVAHVWLKDCGLDSHDLLDETKRDRMAQSPITVPKFLNRILGLHIHRQNVSPLCGGHFKQRHL